MLLVFNTGIASAEQNMESDAKLLESLESRPILHLYEWAAPSATYGYFIDPGKYLNLAGVEKHHLSLARRPTGGGIVFHIRDLAFSFLMPSNHPFFSLNTLENYRFVNEIVLDTMREYFSLKDPVELIGDSDPSASVDCQNFCMAKPTVYDVVYKGAKIAGAAQRRRRQGYLHQGTISLALPEAALLNDVLLSKSEVLDAMLKITFAPLGKDCCLKQLKETRSEIEALLTRKFMTKLDF